MPGEFEIEEYTESGFWNKCRKYAKSIGRETLEKVLTLYYALQSDKLSAKQKGIIYGALAYLISPIDAIPDLTPLLGYTDDLGIISAAVAAVVMAIDDTVKTKAKNKTDELLGSTQETGPTEPDENSEQRG
ncbi:YkvA family protein [Parasalinivibrio latis]|uniref:YkvA family protein n=1 Tax=Parasalinivibrio latis TaxID=2952610 RepID=UPI0030E4A61A